MAVSTATDPGEIAKANCSTVTQSTQTGERPEPGAEQPSGRTQMQYAPTSAKTPPGKSLSKPDGIGDTDGEEGTEGEHNRLDKKIKKGGGCIDCEWWWDHCCGCCCD
jgi:hypothetical protein